MNSRRSFFKSLALLGAGAVTAPGIFIPKFERGIWKPMLQRVVLECRDYRLAKYEARLIALNCALPDTLGGTRCDWDTPRPVVPSPRIDIFDRENPPEGYHHNWMVLPVRGNNFTLDGKLIPIPPFIELWIR